MPDEDNESASSLRTKLSQSHAKQVEFAARAAIAEKGLSHITVEDIPKGTDPDEVEGVAVSLNDQRETAGLDAMKDMLEAKGVVDVDAAVAEILNGDGKTPPVNDKQDAVERARQVGAGGSPSLGEDITHLGNDGGAQMRHFFEKQEAAKRK